MNKKESDSSLTYRIDTARPSDARGIVTVQYLSWLATYPNDEYQITREDIELKFGDFEEKIRRRFKFLITIENNQKIKYLVARINRGVVGFIYGRRTEGDNLLDALYVLPEHQGKGIGTSLAMNLLVWMGEDRNIRLTAVKYNVKAINFYSKFGFINCGDVQTDFGRFPNGKLMPEILMIKPGINK